MESDDKKQLICRFISIGIIIACVASFVTSFYLKNYYEKNYYILTDKISSESGKSVKDLTTILSDFRKIIDEYYIGDVDEERMINETIKGYVNGLDDEYSQYMTADEWEEYQLQALGNYVGIGIYMSEDEEKNVVVVSSIEDSPAEKIGLLEGDIIVEVNGESVLGLGSSIVSSKIKGEEGTKVSIKILRGVEYISYDVERKAIKVYKVKGNLIDNNIGYIELSTFDEGCSDEFKKEFKNLKSQGANKLIIDLRNNTGGLVTEALSIADMILPKDETMLITVDSKNNKDIEKSMSNPIINMDIVVLVNEYSASASEILVGALQDNNKAKIVGKNTFGKGVIQTVLSLKNGSILKLTTAEYYTPNETKINKIGIKPDVEVELIDDENEVDEQLEAAKKLLTNK